MYKDQAITQASSVQGKSFAFCNSTSWGKEIWGCRSKWQTSMNFGHPNALPQIHRQLQRRKKNLLLEFTSSGSNSSSGSKIETLSLKSIDLGPSFNKQTPTWQMNSIGMLNVCVSKLLNYINPFAIFNLLVTSSEIDSFQRHHMNLNVYFRSKYCYLKKRKENTPKSQFICTWILVKRFLQHITFKVTNDQDQGKRMSYRDTSVSSHGKVTGHFKLVLRGLSHPKLFYR